MGYSYRHRVPKIGENPSTGMEYPVLRLPSRHALSWNHSLDKGFGDSSTRGVDHHDLTFVVFESDSLAHERDL
jgi:hypothetical protein